MIRRSKKIWHRVAARFNCERNAARRGFGLQTGASSVAVAGLSENLIVSVHLPKTAGTSFGNALHAHFRSRLLKDYSDFPINSPPPERNRAALEAGLRNAKIDLSEVACIHGHFLPIKYLLLAQTREVKFVTWMRNPVERILSHFYEWKKTYTPSSPPLHRRIVEEDWSVERFCLGPELRNLYWQFLWGFPIDYFDFIGITEFYEDDLAYFGRRYLGGDVKARHLNAGENNAYQIDRSFRIEIEAFHNRDMDLYKNALEKRQGRHRA